MAYAQVVYGMKMNPSKGQTRVSNAVAVYANNHMPKSASLGAMAATRTIRHGISVYSLFGI